MDHQLVRYVLASRVLSEGARSCVLANGVHDGFGAKLLNIVMGLPIASPRRDGAAGALFLT